MPTKSIKWNFKKKVDAVGKILIYCPIRVKTCHFTASFPSGYKRWPLIIFFKYPSRLFYNLVVTYILAYGVLLEVKPSNGFRILMSLVWSFSLPSSSYSVLSNQCSGSSIVILRKNARFLQKEYSPFGDNWISTFL